ncbi:MAG: DUF6273 domain-containing protein [Eubacterium sp.]|nr:DUF6273 domain-containing protein [Eubacterium sp.]
MKKRINKFKRMTGILTVAAVFCSVFGAAGHVNAAGTADRVAAGSDSVAHAVYAQETGVSQSAKAGTWHKNAKGWWYGYPDGSYENSGWKKISGKWYYFDEAGYMASKEWRDGYWLNKDGTWTYKYRASWSRTEYTFLNKFEEDRNTHKSYGDSSGWKAESGWYKIDGKWYYFDHSCALKGHVGTYIFDSSGAYKTGWVKEDGKWYYSGAPTMDWKKISGKWYFFDNDGAIVTEPFLRYGTWYLFDESGAWIVPATSLSEARVGGQVYFGRYEQDANPDNGKERILWRVLDKKDGKLLLMSESLLDTCFDYLGVWEDCKERKFLNGEFMDTAFTKKERAKISLTTVKNEQYVHLGDTGESWHTAQNDTEDYVYLLSIDEVCKYFGTTYDDIYKQHLLCLAAGTKYYHTKGYTDYVPGDWIPWRLRTSPNFLDYPYAIGYNGNLTWVGVEDIMGEGLRPVMWVTP